MFSFAKKVLALCVLSAVLAIASCETDEPDVFVDDHKLNTALIGTWMSEYNDGYTITATTLSYDDGGYGYDYSSTIRYASNFTHDAGVIIVEYTSGVFQGKFIGIYYEYLNPGISVMMADALNADYSNPARDTLEAAKQTFTMGNKGTYVSLMGTYTK